MSIPNSSSVQCRSLGERMGRGYSVAGSALLASCCRPLLPQSSGLSGRLQREGGTLAYETTAACFRRDLASETCQGH